MEKISLTDSACWHPLNNFCSFCGIIFYGLMWQRIIFLLLLLLKERNKLNTLKDIQFQIDLNNWFCDKDTSHTKEKYRDNFLNKYTGDGKEVFCWLRIVFLILNYPNNLHRNPRTKNSWNCEKIPPRIIRFCKDGCSLYDKILHLIFNS